jgi:hypothetical protein
MDQVKDFIMKMRDQLHNQRNTITPLVRGESRSGLPTSYAERQSVDYHDHLIKSIPKAGLKIHYARGKWPDSFQAKAMSNNSTPPRDARRT